MRKHKLIVGALLVIAGLFGFGSAAFAASGTITPTPPFSSPRQTVTIQYSNMTPNQPVILAMCNNDQGASFDPVIDCSPFHTLFVNGTPSGAGTETLELAEVPDDADDLGWTCDRTGTPDGATTDTSGRRKFSQCQLRINDNTLTSTANVTFLPISWTGGPDPVIPEAPFAILLPLAGLAAAGGAYLVLRGRRTLTV